MRNGRRLTVRSIRFLPFLFTFGNAFFGLCSIILALDGAFVTAAYAIFLGAMMDALDGRVARLMKVESALGLELDSLCDAISFCLAPAFLAYCWVLRPLGFIGIVMSAIFMLSGLFRLGRFNLLVSEQPLFFIGLPTTIAGCSIATVLLNSSELVEKAWLPFVGSVLLLVLAGLMVSSIPFPSFKKGVLRVKRHYHIMSAIALFAVLVVMRLKFALLIFFIGYFVTAFLCALKRDDAGQDIIALKEKI